MNVFTRPAVAGAVFAVAGLLAGCSGGSDAGSASPGGEPSASDVPQGDGSGIDNPKNVRGVDSCGLLSPEALKSLGMNPDGERQGNLFDSDIPERCEWKTPDGGGATSMTPFPDRSIEYYYQNSQEFKDFAKLEVAGYPAVRATKGDNPKAEGSCAVYVAPQEGQLLSADTVLDNDPSDPCVKSKQALEAALQKLPAAK